MIRKTPCFIYRAYAADCRLLYIGQTRQPEARIRNHARQSHWFAEAAEWEFEQVAGWYEMQAAEKAAIKTERPLYNVQHNTNREIA